MATGAGNQSRWRREPQPVACHVADPADLAAKDHVLVPEYQQLGVPGAGPAPSGSRASADEQADDRDDHSARIPARKPIQATSGNRAPQGSPSTGMRLTQATGNVALMALGGLIAIDTTNEV